MNILKAYLIETSELEEKFNMGKSMKKIGKGFKKFTSKFGRKKPSKLALAAKIAGGAGLAGMAAGAAFRKPLKRAGAEFMTGYKTDSEDVKFNRKARKERPAYQSGATGSTKAGEYAGELVQKAKGLLPKKKEDKK